MSHWISFPQLTRDSALTPAEIGGKASGLRHLYALNGNTPPAEVIPTAVFSEMLNDLGLDHQLEVLASRLGDPPPKAELEAIRHTIQNAPLSAGLRDQIRAIQQQWTAEFGPSIIVRSSATVEDNARHSFAGIFDSIPCQTVPEIETAVRTVWASVFSPRAFAYYGIASLTHFPQMALILQPFIAADWAGVMFTRYPGPNQRPQILIEYVAGGGAKLVTGQVNPDRFWLERWPDEHTLPDTVGELGSLLALDLAQAAKDLEAGLGAPQDVEWCVQDQTLYLLQTRPITAVQSSQTSPSLENSLLQGVGASPGWASGAVHLVFNIEDADALQTGQVLTTTMTNPDMVPSMQRSAAVVTDVGGMICHAAIVSRELGIPCVVGTSSATKTLAATSLVTVDGSSGTIYQGQVSSPDPDAQKPPLQWENLWAAWQTAVPVDTVPLISTRHALLHSPPTISACVLDPFTDLSLDPQTDITALNALSPSVVDHLLSSYLARLTDDINQAQLKTLYLSTDWLPPNVIQTLEEHVASHSNIVLLTKERHDGPWHLHTAANGRSAAILHQLTAALNAPPSAIPVIPLGFGLLLSGGPIEMPTAPDTDSQGMFGMMPQMIMAPMPPAELRRPMHQLLPKLAQAHGGQVPTAERPFPWLNLRPEVVITPFLKALVTPGVECIPLTMGFNTPPLHIQFKTCRFHFRQDTLFGFFPQLMQATWDESFLSIMLRQCRASYERLEAQTARLPEDEAALQMTDQAALEASFIDWWRTFSDFFSLSFFIQAQGDDCVFPGLGQIAAQHLNMVEGANPPWQLPGLMALTAPVEPVLTADYIADLVSLKQTLTELSIEELDAAEAALNSGQWPQLNAHYDQVWQRWHWMRERDLFYEPYDTPRVILEKAMTTREAAALDYHTNQEQANLALALHVDLGRLSGSLEQVVYGVKYGRALAIDRENHHIVWLRASYKLRQLLLEWERRLAAHAPLKERDIFFMQPWEILNAAAALPQPLDNHLIILIRNRRAAYEQEIQLKAGQLSTVVPQPEQDYF